MFIIVFFFFNDTATTEIYTLSLHDALPIWIIGRREQGVVDDHAVPTGAFEAERDVGPHAVRDRKSTRLNSSHGYISYAVFCLKKKYNQDSTRELPAPSMASLQRSHMFHQCH